MALVGTSGSGKSTFAEKHFKPTEVISSDYCRGLVSDDENSQAATSDAFDVLHYIAGKRLKAGRLTVIDATNVQREARKPILVYVGSKGCPSCKKMERTIWRDARVIAAVRKVVLPGMSYGKYMRADVVRMFGELKDGGTDEAGS